MKLVSGYLKHWKLGVSGSLYMPGHASRLSPKGALSWAMLESWAPLWLCGCGASCAVSDSPTQATQSGEGQLP